MTVLDLHPVRSGIRYTLRGIFETEAEAQAKATQLVADGLEALGYTDVAPDGKTLFFVAARHHVEPTSRAGIPHTRSAAWDVTRFAIALFRTLTKDRAGRPPVRWYKDLDVQTLHSKIQGFETLGNTNGERAAALLSSLIVAHPFPNANHRTSLDLVRYYFASLGIQWPYELRGAGRDRFHRDTKKFFVESKYLLQLIRHKMLLRRAHGHGYRVLEIGPNATRDLVEADLTLRDNEVTKRHRSLCLKTIQGLGAIAVHAKITASPVQGLEAWANWLNG